MKKHLQKLRKLVLTAFFLLLTFLILTHSSESLHYALNGLNLWFTKMIPVLFPFMVLSGIMVRLHLTEGFVNVLYPALSPLLRVRRNVCYAVVMGFLCGFPMGARVACDLLERDMITEREAEFLLAFCNNIGPVYFCSFALPLLERRLVWPYILGMYGLPLLYGLVLRRTAFRDLDICPDPPVCRGELVLCAAEDRPLTILSQIDDAVSSSIQSILMLGGYMILFNLLNLLPAILLPALKLPGELQLLAAPILEITGGLGMLNASRPLFSLLLLPFGGLSCIAQTYSMTKNTRLSIGSYVRHKAVLTALTACYYAGWYLFLPSSFLL